MTPSDASRRRSPGSIPTLPRRRSRWGGATAGRPCSAEHERRRARSGAAPRRRGRHRAHARRATAWCRCAGASSRPRWGTGSPSTGDHVVGRPRPLVAAAPTGRGRRRRPAARRQRRPRAARVRPRPTRARRSHPAGRGPRVGRRRHARARAHQGRPRRRRSTTCSPASTRDHPGLEVHVTSIDHRRRHRRAWRSGWPAPPRSCSVSRGPGSRASSTRCWAREAAAIGEVRRGRRQGSPHHHQPPAPPAGRWRGADRHARASARSGLAGDEDSVDATFTDIDDLAAACRFTDCAHEGEPGCAVAAAVAAGELPGGAARARSWSCAARPSRRLAAGRRARPADLRATLLEGRARTPCNQQHRAENGGDPGRRTRRSRSAAQGHQSVGSTKRSSRGVNLGADHSHRPSEPKLWRAMAVFAPRAPERSRHEPARSVGVSPSPLAGSRATRPACASLAVRSVDPSLPQWWWRCSLRVVLRRPKPPVSSSSLPAPFPCGEADFGPPLAAASRGVREIPRVIPQPFSFSPVNDLLSTGYPQTDR